MDLPELVPGLYAIPLGISNAYLWRGADGATLVDAGPPGSGAAIREALAHLGVARDELRGIVLTHFHDDHAGAAADLAAWSGAPVSVGRGDASYVRGDDAGPPPRFTEAEAALHAVVAADLQPAPPVGVDVELAEGDAVDGAGLLRVLAVPGHTDGSIALHLPEHGVLLTGDTVAEHEGGVVLGPFNLNRERAWASLQRLAALDVDVAAFGHGRRSWAARPEPCARPPTCSPDPPVSDLVPVHRTTEGAAGSAALPAAQLAADLDRPVVLAHSARSVAAGARRRRPSGPHAAHVREDVGGRPVRLLGGVRSEEDEVERREALGGEANQGVDDPPGRSLQGSPGTSRPRETVTLRA